MSEKITVTLGVKTEQAKANIDALQAQANLVATRWNMTYRQIVQEMQYVTRVASGLAGVVSATALALGDTIDPAFHALITVVQSASAALSAVATAYTSTGVGAVAGAIVATAVFILNVKTMADLMSGRDEMQAEINNMRNTANSLTALVNALAR